MTETSDSHAPLAVEAELEIPRCERGEALLKAINDGDVASLGGLLTADVRLTSFDRGEIHEAQGREAVCERLGRLGEITGSRFAPTGSREADDALFFWGRKLEQQSSGLDDHAFLLPRPLLRRARLPARIVFELTREIDTDAGKRKVKREKRKVVKRTRLKVF